VGVESCRTSADLLERAVHNAVAFCRDRHFFHVGQPPGGRQERKCRNQIYGTATRQDGSERFGVCA
jgi:hypothetical protein